MASDESNEDDLLSEQVGDFLAISEDYRKDAFMDEGEDFKILGVAFADFN